MNAISIHDPSLLPLFIIASSLVLITLLALTMRSIIMREKAMIRRNRHDADARASYESRWRTPGAA